MPLPPGGYGSEPSSSPWGSGGPLHVNRARAVAGQTVRVVYDEEPFHQSPAGYQDALNPSNYAFTVVTGSGDPPQAVGVDLTMTSFPAKAVNNPDERAFDVRVDRPLVVGVTFRVTVSRVISRLGGPLGAPVSADFAGIVRPSEYRQATRRTDQLDFRSDPFVGRLVVQGGDIATHGGLDSLRKRVLRRLITPRGSFVFAPQYGTRLRLKQTITPGELASMKADIATQLREEPDVRRAAVDMRLLSATGILQVQVDVQSALGNFQQGLSVAPDGSIVIP